MAGTASDESGGGRSLEGISSGQLRCQSGEALAEWRSSEQVENGIPSTSPPYWDTDDEDDCGPKPSELYGKYTWKIDKFSQINKRELRSNAFEVGGYKWYILIYPQGCDVCNHLSLFLCVANHDKLLPGWSHFAQFTIAVVNKDPKKSKYSDTLHRFWKKEHDWGWKKFMELSKVLDGFIDADTLIIKAQVQVIRERADRPFRCLDCQYRRELVRVYLTNVEQICRRFVEERRGKLGKLIEDKARWSSFCAFWLGIDQTSRRRMSREKTDSILKVVVKHFFIEKEVTSTLVMDSLYSGLKALEGQIKSKKCKGKYLDSEELPVPIVRIEKETFVLVDDVLLLLERAAMEPLPPKDEKGPQNRTKDGGSGEDFTKDSIERDERRLTELGRRTIEIFVLAHIFSSKIEVAYQEAVALKRQEELIREEEAAWLLETEQKAKRGATEKEKKPKKKQGKHKRNKPKGKDKGREEKTGIVVLNNPLEESPTDVRQEFLNEDAELVLEQPDLLDDVSDVSDSLDCVHETRQPDSEDRDSSPVNWDTDTSEIHPLTEASSSGISGLSAVQNGERKSPSVIDDSSSTCSSDSLPSVVMNGPYKGNSLPNLKSQKSPSRVRNRRGKATTDATGCTNDSQGQPSEGLPNEGQAHDVSADGKVAESESEAVVHSLQDRIKWLEQHVEKKVEEEVVSLQRKLTVKDEVDMESPLKEKTTAVLSSPRSPPKKLSSSVQLKSESKTSAASELVLVRKPSSESTQPTGNAALINSAETIIASRPNIHKAATSKSAVKPIVQQVPVTTEKPRLQQVGVTTEKSTTQVPVTTEKVIMQQVPVMSRPLSAPLIPGPRPTAPLVSMVQTPPLLSRSVSAAGRLGPDPSPATHSYVPQSYRNAMMGNPIAASSAGFTQPHSPNSVVSTSHSYSQPPGLMSAPIFLPQSSERMESNSIRPSLSFGMVNHDVLQNGPQWMECPQRDSNRSMHYDRTSPLNDNQNFDMYKSVRSRSQDHFPTESVHSRSQDHFPSEFTACTSGRPAHGVMADEFPHLDIINDLLDDEQGIGKATQAGTGFHSFSNGPHHLNRQFTFPGDIGLSNDPGPSTSSCRFERTRSYHDDEIQRGYGSSGGHFDSLREMTPQANLRPYPNGPIDGLIPNQWQMAGSDLSFLSTRNAESDGHPYHFPEYSNLACGVNGYTIFRPSNGH
ncbi:hypothetical protein RJ640_022024 [Escallonia rubra]|uniref:MATH domain-containing protein n=1 Tax=Escallonia rubra TaxID=112253 RepID=A0AA88QNE7_9ASTE|nr:hypothetical protein RJ640_022024 [Escallonia rubra]